VTVVGDTRTVTILSDLINPEVMGDMVTAEMTAKIKFSPLAEFDYSLKEQPGNTITLPYWKYVGDAQIVAENEGLDAVLLESDFTTATVVKAVRNVEITDEALLSGYGDPMGETTLQLGKSLAAAVDNALVAALQEAPLKHDAGGVAEGEAAAVATKLTYAAVVDAIDKFSDEDDEEMWLIIHPDLKTQLRQDPLFVSNDDMKSGVIGEIAGCKIIVSRRCPKVDGTYTSFIVKPGALSVFIKREAEVETQRVINPKKTIISADIHFATALRNDSKVVQLYTGISPAGENGENGEAE